MILPSQLWRENLAICVLALKKMYFVFFLFLTQHTEPLLFHDESILVAVQVHWDDALPIHGQVLFSLTLLKQHVARSGTNPTAPEQYVTTHNKLMNILKVLVTENNLNGKIFYWQQFWWKNVLYDML